MDFQLARKPGDNEASAPNVNPGSLTHRNHEPRCQKTAENSAFRFRPAPHNRFSVIVKLLTLRGVYGGTPKVFGSEAESFLNTPSKKNVLSIPVTQHSITDIFFFSFEINNNLNNFNDKGIFQIQ